MLKIKKICCVLLCLLSSGAFSFEKDQEGQVTLPELTIDFKESRFGENDFQESSRETLFFSEDKVENLPKILNSHSKIQLAPSGSFGDSPRFYIRGMDNLQTRFFFEGFPLSEPIFQSNSLLFLPAYALGSLEVFPSAVPTSYLSSGLGGAVNVKLPSHSKHTHFQTEWGSFDFLRGSAKASLFANAQLAADYVQSNENYSFWDNNGTPWNTADDQLKERENNSFKRLSLLPFWDFYFGKGVRGTIFSLNGFQNKMTPGSVEKPQANLLKEWNHLSALKLIIPLGSHWMLESSAYFRKIKEDLFSKTGTLGRMSDHSTAGGKVSCFFREKLLESRLSLGIESHFVELKDLQRSESTQKISQVEAPISLTNTIELGPKLFLYPSFLGIVVQPSGNSQESWNMNSSLRLGVEQAAFSSGKVRAFFGSVFRSPSLSERFGLQTGIVGNPQLKNETALKADAGFVWESRSQTKDDAIQVTYTVFGAQAKNLISYVQNSPNTHRPENISSAVWVGQELGMVYQNQAGFLLQPSLLWMWTRNNSSVVAETGKSLPHLSPWSTKVATFWKRGKWSLSHHLGYFSENFIDKANQQKSEGVITQDFSLGYSDKHFGRLELKILNLFDRKLAKVSSLGLDTEQYLGGGTDYPSFGRRVSVSWALDL